MRNLYIILNFIILLFIGVFNTKAQSIITVIPDITINDGQTISDIDLTNHFDHEMEVLVNYQVMIGNTALLGSSVTGEVLSLNIIAGTGTSTVKVTANYVSGASIDDTFNVTINAEPVADGATFLMNVTVDEDDQLNSQLTIDLTGQFTDDMPAADLNYEISSNNTSVITVDATITSPTLNLTLVENAFTTGTPVEISVKAVDQGGLKSAAKTFNVNVTSVNDIPQLVMGASLDDKMFAEDNANGDNLTISLAGLFTDVETSNLNYLIQSSDITKVTVPTGVHTTNSFDLGLVMDAVTTVPITITITAQDEAMANSVGDITFEVSIARFNEIPVATTESLYNSTESLVIDEDNPTMVDLSVSLVNKFTDDRDTASLTFSASSEDTNIIEVPTGSITGTDFMMTLKNDAFTTSPIDISVTATDTEGGTSLARTFAVTVNAVNDLPTLTGTGIADLTFKKNNDDGQSLAVDLSGVFIDVEDGTNLTYNISSSDDTKVIVPTMPLTGTSTFNLVLGVDETTDAGSPVIITASAEDTNGGTSMNETFNVVIEEVTPPSTTNPPVATMSSFVNLSLQEDNEDMMILQLSAAGQFVDNDNSDPLEYLVTSSNTSVITVPTTQLTSPLFDLTLVNDANTDGISDVTIEVKAVDSDGNQSLPKSFDVSVAAINDEPEPTTVVLSNKIYKKNNLDGMASDLVIDLTGNFTDVEDLNTSLTFTATSSDDSKVMVPTGSITSPSLTLSLAPNTTTTSPVSVTVKAVDSEGAESTAKTFDVTINDANSVPTAVGTLSDLTFNEDNAAPAGNLTVDLTGIFTDLEDDIAGTSLAYSVTSSDTNIITVPATVNTQTFDLNLVSDAFTNAGTPVEISVTAIDSDMESSTPLTFDVTVNAVNDSPVALSTTLPNKTYVEDNPSSASVSIDLSSAFTDVDDTNLTYEISSSLNGVVSVPSTVTMGTSFNLTLVKDKFTNSGSPAIITVTAKDDDNATSANVTFEVTVTSENDAPEKTAGNFAARTYNRNNSTGAAVAVDLASEFSDVEDDFSDLDFTITSSQPSVVTVPSTLAMGTTSFDLTFGVNASTPMSTPAIISVTATDTEGASSMVKTMEVTVTDNNTAPTGTALTFSNITTKEDNPDGDNLSIDLTGQFVDLEDDLAMTDLQFQVTSTDTNIITVPTGDITGTSFDLTLVDEAFTMSGSPVTISVRAKDSEGSLSSPKTFTVLVTSINDKPEVTASTISNRSFDEDETTSGDLTIDLSGQFTDIETIESNLVYNVTSSNPTAVQVPSIAVSTSSFDLVLGQNQFTTSPVTISITAEDEEGALSVAKTFNVSIASVNDKPKKTGAGLSNLTVDEDETNAASLTISLLGVFSDEEQAESTLSFEVVSGDTGKITVNSPVTTTSFPLQLVSNQFTEFGSPVAISVRAIDNMGAKSDAETFTVTINPVNDLPTPNASTIAPVTIMEDETMASLLQVSFSNQFTDLEDSEADLRYLLTSSDPTIIGVPNEVNSASFNFTLGANKFTLPTEKVTVTVKAKDTDNGVSLASKAIDFEVTPVNDRPIVISTQSDIIAFEDQNSNASLSIDLTNLFEDVDNDPLSYQVNISDPSVVSSTVLGNNLQLVLANNKNTDGKSDVQITITATDNASLPLTSNSVDFKLRVNGTDDPPVLTSAIPDITVDEDDQAPATASLTIDLSNHFSDPDGGLSFSATSNNTNHATVSVLGNTLTISPILNAFTGDANGTNATQITVTADDGNDMVSDTFTISINPINDSPQRTSLNFIDIVVPEDAPDQVIDLSNYYTDIDNATISYVVSSGDNTKVLTSVSSSMLTLDFVEDAFTQSGESVIISVIATDGEFALTAETFTVEIQESNDSPSVVNPLADRTNDDEDDPNATISFANVFNDPDTPVLTYSVTSSKPEVIDASIVSQTIVLDFQKDAFTSSSNPVLITLTADDGNASVSDEFTVIVRSINDRPTASLTVLNNLTVDEDRTGLQPIILNTLFEDVDDTNLIYSAVPSDNNKVNLQITSGELQINLAQNENTATSGPVNIAITARDSFNETVSRNFDLTINAINDIPKVENPIPNQTLLEDSGVTEIELASVFSDVEDSNLTLQVELSSNASTILEAPLVGTKLQISLFENKETSTSGSIDVTVTAIDSDNAMISDSFKVSVTPVNDKPSFTQLPDINVNEDAVIADINLANFFEDIEDVDSQLTYAVKTISNTGLVTQKSLTPSGVLTLELVPNKFGVSTVTVTATDLDNAVSDDNTFSVEVQNINDLPELNFSINPLNYQEGDGDQIVDSQLTLTDNDDGETIKSATVQFESGFNPSEDRITIPSNIIPGITVDTNTSTGVITLTGVSQIGNYQTLFRILQYENINTIDPSTTNRVLKISVLDSNDGAASDTKLITIGSTNSAPIVTFPIPDRTGLVEDADAFVLDLHTFFEDVEDADSELIYEVKTLTNEMLVSASITGNKNLTITPQANAFGSTDITIKVTDTDGSVVEDTFTVTISGENDIPTTTGIPAIDLLEDQPLKIVDLKTFFADIENDATALIYEVQSNDNTEIFNALGFTDGSKLNIETKANLSGVANLEIKVTDLDGGIVTTGLVINVESVNDAPVLGDFTFDAVIKEDAGQQVIFVAPSNVGPLEDIDQTLVYEVKTDSELIETMTFLDEPDGFKWFYTAKDNVFGVANICLKATDSGPGDGDNINFTERCIDITIESVNDAPTIDPIIDPNTIFVNAGEQMVELTGITAGGNEDQNLSLTVISNNESLIPSPPASNLRLEYTSPDDKAKIFFTPLPGQDGVANILVIVQDDGVANSLNGDINRNNVSFQVTVKPFNNPPTIDMIPDIVGVEDDEEIVVTLTGVTPGNNEEQEIAVRFLSNRDELISPASEGSFIVDRTVGEEDEWELKLKPNKNQCGEAEVSIILTDDGPSDDLNQNETIQKFKLTLDCINDAPSFAEIPDQPSYKISSTPQAITISNISAGPNEENQEILELTAVTDNPDLIDQSSIKISEISETTNEAVLTYQLKTARQGIAGLEICLKDNGPNAPAPNINSFCQKIQIRVTDDPDLKAERISITSGFQSIARGQTFETKLVVANIGNSDIVSPSPLAVNLFLTLDENNILPEDLLTTFSDIQIAQGGAQEFKFTVQREQTISRIAGDYKLVAVVDPGLDGGQIKEIDEMNNTIAIPLILDRNIEPKIILEAVNDDEFIDITQPNAVRVFNIDNNDTNLKLTGQKILYRGITSSDDFIESELSFRTGSRFQFTMNSFVSDPIGFEYKFISEDEDGRTDQTEIRYVYYKYDDGLTVPNIMPGTSQSDYNLVSTPLDLDRKGLQSVFDEFGGYDINNWRAFRFENNRNNEIENGAIEIGESIWLIARPGTTDVVDNGSFNINSGAGRVIKATKVSPHKITLEKGWNQIATPYNMVLSWADVLEANGDKAGPISENLKFYENGNYRDTKLLFPFSGSFVFTDSRVEDLIIPVIKNVGIQNVGNGRKSTREYNLSSDEWITAFNLTGNSWENELSYIGMKNQALDGYDRNDQVLVPTLGQIPFRQFEFEKVKNRDYTLSANVHAKHENDVWNFKLKANKVLESNIFSWYHINLPEGKQLWILDEVSGVWTDMKVENSLTFSGNKERSFKVVYGEPSFVEKQKIPQLITFSEIYPNPFNDYVNLSMHLPKSKVDWDVTMNIINLSGQVVATPYNHVTFKEGPHTLKWTIKKDALLQTVNGVYILNVMIQNDTEQISKRFRILKN